MGRAPRTSLEHSTDQRGTCLAGRILFWEEALTPLLLLALGTMAVVLRVRSPRVTAARRCRLLATLLHERSPSEFAAHRSCHDGN